MAKKETSAADVDDLLAGKSAPTKKAAKKAAEPEKKPAAKKAKADDVLEGKKPAKKAAKPAEKKARAESVNSDELRAKLLKCRKLTTFQQFADSHGYNLRTVRRTARAMRNEGLLENTKEGTVIFFKAA